jgi:hypothetical protein
MGGPDQNVLRWNAPDRRPHAIAEPSRKAQEIRADDRYPVGSFLKNQRAYRQIALFARDWVGRPNPAHDRQKWIGSNYPHGDASAKAGRRVYCNKNQTEKENASFHSVAYLKAQHREHPNDCLPHHDL